MTFDEVLDEMDENQKPSESIRFMEKLCDIYASTIKMWSGQKKTIRDEKYKDNLTALLNDGNYGFDVLFWEPLTET